MLFSENLERLIQSFNRFPGIGKKTAQRLAWYLVAQDKNFALNLAEIIKTTVENFTTCSRCNMLSKAIPALLALL
jgi:recombination protein RecR